MKVHPIKEGRRVPLKQLIKKLNVEKYNVSTPYLSDFKKPKKVKILFKQHVGTPAIPKVGQGDIVEKGELIGEIENGKLGARIHASIKGKITELNNDFVVIEDR